MRCSTVDRVRQRPDVVQDVTDHSTGDYLIVASGVQESRRMSNDDDVRS